MAFISQIKRTLPPPNTREILFPSQQYAESCPLRQPHLSHGVLAMAPPGSQEPTMHVSFFFFFFWPRGILVPWPGIEPVPPAVEAQSPNHWTAREFPHAHLFPTLPSRRWPNIGHGGGIYTMEIGKCCVSGLPLHPECHLLNIYQIITVSMYWHHHLKLNSHPQNHLPTSIFLKDGFLPQKS